MPVAAPEAKSGGRLGSGLPVSVPSALWVFGISPAASELLRDAALVGARCRLLPQLLAVLGVYDRQRRRPIVSPLPMTFAPIPELLAELRAGRPIVLVDDPDRENEGDLCFAAEFATPELVALMSREACGLICLALDNAICDQLQLPMMVAENRSRFGTAFTVSIEATEGVTTGIFGQGPGQDDSRRSCAKRQADRPGATGPHLPAACR